MNNQKVMRIIIFLSVVLLSCSNENNDIKKEYYPNGKLKVIKNLKNGITDGQAQWFYATGSLEQIVSFRDGKENGNAYYFYQSGALKNFRNWKGGKMVGYGNDFFDSSVWIIKAVLYYNSLGDLIYRKTYDSLGNVITEEGRIYK